MRGEAAAAKSIIGVLASGSPLLPILIVFGHFFFALAGARKGLARGSRIRHPNTTRNCDFDFTPSAQSNYGDLRFMRAPHVPRTSLRLCLPSSPDRGQAQEGALCSNHHLATYETWSYRISVIISNLAHHHFAATPTIFPSQLKLALFFSNPLQQQQQQQHLILSRLLPVEPDSNNRGHQGFSTYLPACQLDHRSTTAMATTTSAAAAAAAGPSHQGFPSSTLQVPKYVGQTRSASSDRARSFRRTQYKKSAKARLEELVREVTAERHEREAREISERGRTQLDESIKLLHDRHAALELWSQELRCGGERSRSRSASRTRGGESGPE